MKDFIHILRRFVPPYKGYLAANIFFNILSALLNLFSFALIIPILNILFEIDKEVYSYMAVTLDITSAASWQEYFSALSNNFFWYVTDMINTKGGSYTLIVLGVFLTISTFVKVMAMYLSFYTMIPVRTGVVRDIRNQINRKITSLPLAFFSEERKGDIIARVSGDVNEIETSIMSSLDMLFKNPILIVIYLVGMLLISWELTVFVFVLLPVAGYIMGQVGKKLKRSSLEAQQQWGALMNQIEETLGGLRIIKAFNAEKMIQNRFETSNEEYRRTINAVYRRQQMAHPMSEFLGTATIAVVLWFGGSLILSDSSAIDASTFIYYLIIFYSIINPAKELSRASYAIQKGMASMERVDKILEAENNITNPETPKHIELKDAIRFDDVWFKYAKDWVIKGVNLTIRKGTRVALVGSSGSGKSTLVDLIPRFYDVDRGRISIDGVNIKEANVVDLRGLMGNVNQEAILFNDTFRNNICFGVPNASDEQVERAAKIANAHDFIMASEQGYDTRVGDRGGKLSGGQRQRISIARAILKDPSILILDEATSALDTESEHLVQEALDKLTKNRTTIVIAHRLSTIRSADLICVMHDGVIAEQGTHEELMERNGIYYRLISLQEM